MSQTLSMYMFTQRSLSSFPSSPPFSSSNKIHDPGKIRISPTFAQKYTVSGCRGAIRGGLCTGVSRKAARIRPSPSRRLPTARGCLSSTGHGELEFMNIRRALGRGGHRSFPAPRLEDPCRRGGHKETGIRRKRREGRSLLYCV